VQQLLDAMTDAPAFVRNSRLDILAANRLGQAVYAPVFDTPIRPANLARFAFLDPRATEFYPDWDAAANTTVNLLRIEAGRAPHDRALSDLVGELATRSDDFRARWAGHNVRLHQNGVKHFRHPVVGDVIPQLRGDAAPDRPRTDPDRPQRRTRPPTQDALKLLASWATTLDQAQTPDATNPV
jgi:hypothetical protein